MTTESPELLEQVRRALGGPVPYADHTRVGFTEVGEGRAVATMPEDRDLTNHIGSQHAGALFTLAETAASGAVAGAFGDGLAAMRPLVTGAEASYTAIARGVITATAELATPPAGVLAAVTDDGRARFDVEVSLTDTEGTTVATVTVHWYVSRPRA